MTQESHLKASLFQIPIGTLLIDGDATFVKVKKGDKEYLLKRRGEVIIERQIIETLDLSGKQYTHFCIPSYEFWGGDGVQDIVLMEYFAQTIGHKRLVLDGTISIPDNFFDYIPALIATSLEFMSIGVHDHTLTTDKYYIKKTYNQRAYDWSQYIINAYPQYTNLLNTLQELLHNTDQLETALSHGNLWQDHLALHPNGKLVVFDFGTTSFMRPRYYDALFMIHRMYTGMESPEYAVALWNELLNQIEKSDIYDSNQLREYARYIFAQRAIGGIFDAVEDARYSLKYSIEFAENFENLFELD